MTEHRRNQLLYYYDTGLLCKCTKQERILVPDETGGHFEYEIIHKPTCEGRAKLMAAMMGDDNGEVQSE